VLTAAEMQAARVVLKIVDAATKVFLDQTVIIETYGNASAQHAFDFDTASAAQSVDNNTILSGLNDVSTSDLNTACDTVTVTSMATDVITAAAISTEAVSEIQSGLSTVTEAQVNAQCDIALSDYDPPTRAELTTDTNSIITQVNANETKIDTIDTVVDRIEDDTQNIQAQIGTDGAGLTNMPWNASWDAEVQSECIDALNAYDPPTNTEMTTAFTEIKGATFASTDTLEAIRDRGDAAWVTGAGGSAPTVGEIRTEMETNGGKLDHLWEMTEDDSGTRRYTANALEEAPSGTGGDATAANQATIQADLDILTGADGVILNTTQANYAPATSAALTTVDNEIAAMQSNVTDILADTNELQGDWTNTGRLDTILDAVNSKTTNLPADPASETNVDANETKIDTMQGNVTSILEDTGTTLDGKINTIDGIVDTILVDTNSLNDTKIPDTISLAAINAEVDTALDTAISSPTADSINDYIARMKKVMVNKMEITEADGATVIYEDNDVTEYCNVAAAYASDSTTTTRKRLE